MKGNVLTYGVAITLLATTLVACGGSAPAAPAAAPAVQATAAPQPTITLPTSAAAPELSLGISGSGEVKAAQDADLVFQTTGTVAEVKVKEGDAIKKGDLLAILDVRAFDQQVQQAQAALDNANAQQSALDAIKSGPKAPDRAQVEAALQLAQTNLQMTRDKLSLAKTAAESQLQQAVDGLTQAQARYAQAKSNWQHVQDEGTDPIMPNVTNTSTGKKTPNKLNDAQRQAYAVAFQQAEAALHQAEQAVQLAQANAENARQSEVTGIAAAEQQLAQAQAAMDKVNLPPDNAQLASAQAGLAQAQAAQSKLTAAPRDAQKAAAAAGVAQAQAALELARINREHAELRAPFDGVIAAVNVDPGDPSATGQQPAIKVVDVSSLHVDAQISDVDIVQVSVGQAVEVRADAAPDKVYQGKVSYIAPTASTVGTIRTYLVRVALDNPQGLRAGMSARVDIKTK